MARERRNAPKRWVKAERLFSNCLHYRAIAAHLRNQSKCKLPVLALHLPAQNIQLDFQLHIYGISLLRKIYLAFVYLPRFSL